MSMPRSDRFEEIIQELMELHAKKAADYGADLDPLFNLRMCEYMGIPAWQGVVIRLTDKIARLMTFARKGTLQNESVEDTFRDIAVYAILGLILYQDHAR